MTTPATTQLKLGLFAIVAVAALVAAAFGLGLNRMKSRTIPYHTYFDESVQGLEIGSPVRYRGVPIGTVTGISVAPDRRHVDVALAIDELQAKKLELANIPNLRAKLATQGITGVLLVNIDLIDPRMAPLPELEFRPDHNYIPAAPSLIKGLEDGLTTVIQQMPALLEVVGSALHGIDVIVSDFEGEHLPQRLGKALDAVNGAAADLRVLLRKVDRAKIPDKTAKAIDSLDEAIGKAAGVLGRIEGQDGVLTSTKRAADAVGDFGRSATKSTQDLDQTLRRLDEAVQAITDLARELERDPDMLLKGHGQEKVR